MSKSMPLNYVQVAPCIPLKFGGHESYTYYTNQDIPEGTVVHIPFGKRSVMGVVVQTGVRKPRYPTKQISKIIDAVLTAHQLAFAHRIAQQAHGGLGYTLRMFIV